jgi:hypothetical protein
LDFAQLLTASAIQEDFSEADWSHLKDKQAVLFKGFLELNASWDHWVQLETMLKDLIEKSVQLDPFLLWGCPKFRSLVGDAFLNIDVGQPSSKRKASTNSTDPDPKKLKS